MDRSTTSDWGISAALRTLSSCGIGLLVPAKKSAGVDADGNLLRRVCCRSARGSSSSWKPASEETQLVACEDH